MLKGCERRMIKIESTESELFEAAYLIIRENAVLPKKCSRDDMIKEALRITEGKLTDKNRGIRRHNILAKLAFFLVGALLTASVFVIFGTF